MKCLNDKILIKHIYFIIYLKILIVIVLNNISGFLLKKYIIQKNIEDEEKIKAKNRNKACFRYFQ